MLLFLSLRLFESHLAFFWETEVDALRKVHAATFNRIDTDSDQGLSKLKLEEKKSYIKKWSKRIDAKLMIFSFTLMGLK